MNVGWSTARIDRVATVSARIGWKALTASEYQDDGYAFLATPNIKGSAIDFGNVNYISAHRYNESPELKLQIGDVLLAKDGSTLGITNVVRHLSRPATVNGSIAVLRPYDVDSRFLMYSLLSHATQSWIDQVKDGMGVPHLFQADIRKFQFSKPNDVSKQQRIADFLDDQVTRIDSMITALEQQAVCTSELENADLVSVVLGSSGRSIPLGYIAFVDHGRQRSPANEYGPCMIPYVRSANVADGRIESDFLEMNFTPKEQELYALRDGDVLVTEASGSVEAIGASAQWISTSRETVCFQNHLLRVRARPNLAEPDFLYWWARASYRAGAMRISATGANILNLGSEALKKMRVPQLGLAEQRAVARKAATSMASNESASSSFRDRAALLAELKRSLITAAVSGEFDVSAADGSQIPVRATVDVPAARSTQPEEVSS